MDAEIALVDPNSSTLILLKNTMRCEGLHAVETFYTGTDFLHALKEGYTPDLVVTENALSDMSGKHMLDVMNNLSDGIYGIITTLYPSALIESNCPFPVIEKGTHDFHYRLIELIVSQCELKRARETSALFNRTVSMMKVGSHRFSG